MTAIYFIVLDQSLCPAVYTRLFLPTNSEIDSDYVSCQCALTEQGRNELKDFSQRESPRVQR